MGVLLATAQIFPCLPDQRLSLWLGCSLPRIYSTLTSSLSECMNCTRLSDMSDRLTTLEAKVRWSGDNGPRELVGEGLASAPGSPAGLSSLVLRDGCCLGLQWPGVTFSGPGQSPGVGEGSGVSKKPEGPRCEGRWGRCWDVLLVPETLEKVGSPGWLA